MLQTGDEYEERAERWRRQAERFRHLSRLIGDPNGGGPLAELARGIDQQICNLAALRAGVIVQSLRTEVLVAELDVVLARARAVLNEQREAPAGKEFNSEDLREATRLCVEEAAATYTLTEKRLVTEQAFALAQLAEQATRRRARPKN